MSHRSPSRSIKKAQKESLLFQAVSKLFLQVTLDDPELMGLNINRIRLSEDGGICTVFFYTPGGESEFNEKRKQLILYKPSMRKALASMIKARYTPELVFKFDDQFEKQERIDQLLDKVKGSE